jgi:hypothetical protein
LGDQGASDRRDEQEYYSADLQKVKVNLNILNIKFDNIEKG